MLLFVNYYRNQSTFSGSFTNHFVPMFLESSESIVKFPVKSHTIVDLSLEPVIILNVNCRETNYNKRFRKLQKDILPVANKFPSREKAQQAMYLL